MDRDFNLRSSAREYGAQSSRRWFSRCRDAALIAMCVLAPSLLVSACGQKNAFIPPPPPKVDARRAPEADCNALPDGDGQYRGGEQHDAGGARARLYPSHQI